MHGQSTGKMTPSTGSTFNATSFSSTQEVSITQQTNSLTLPSRHLPTSSSFREQKKDYNQKKKHFSKSIQTAIDSTQEVHSGWIKARTTFKRWTKVWSQVKPGYLVMYTSQEAQKKHRLGVVILSVCQVIERPTKKEGYCFKLINPFGYSVWAKSSTRALAFSPTSLTIRVTDSSIGKLWLDAFQKCNLSANLNGQKPIIDGTCDLNESLLSNQSDDSDSDDGDSSTRQLGGLILGHSNNTSNNNSISSLNNCQPALSLGKQSISNGNVLSVNHATTSKENQGSSTYKLFDNIAYHGTSKASSRSKKDEILMDNFNNGESKAKRSSSEHNFKSKQAAVTNLNSSKMVAKFCKYNWQELQLENVSYVKDEMEELGSTGIQNEEVHESNKSFLWHIIRQLRPGMDLSKVTLPTFILEPRSFLEKLADYYYHCDILSEAVLIDDPMQRLIGIVKWYLSGFYKKPRGPKKPYNPILGERFRCFWDHPKTGSRTFFVAEQVSHHPPISAFYVSNRKDGYTISCSLLSRSKYLGNSVSAILEGKAKLYLNKRCETYTLTMPYANCKGILLGSLSLELGGKVEIECLETGCKCELDFELTRVWASSSSYNALTGKFFRLPNKITHTVEGHWDKKINIIDKRTNEKSVLWEVTDAVRNSRLKRYTVNVRDQGERESVRLWSKVTEALSTGDQTMATTEKTRLEDMQRQEARERTGTFVPEHFGYAPKNNEWFYRWQDNRPWNERRDIMQFEENFKIKTLMLNSPSRSSTTLEPTDIPSFDSVIDLPVTQLNKFSGQVDPESKFSSNGVVKSITTTPLDEFEENQPYPDTLEAIKSTIEAENLLIKEAIQQVSKKNKELEKDLATLKRGRKIIALMVFATLIAIFSVFFKYFS